MIFPPSMENHTLTSVFSLKVIRKTRLVASIWRTLFFPKKGKSCSANENQLTTAFKNMDLISKLDRFPFLFGIAASATVTFHCRRTLSSGLIEPPHSQKTLVAGSQVSCFSRWSRRLPFQVTWFGQSHELVKT